ncbi:Coiled-coil domain-containing protein 33 [Cichlidogyrus casuarinus]|uniref:Coiled-coil domain-containing protein 33 n=1 Tax=Cichlidogyrus casuarinus TaxID=1844966 RepID=A0ABD2Q162_9PLAT
MADQIPVDGNGNDRHQLLPNYSFPESTLLDDPLVHYASGTESLPPAAEISQKVQRVVSTQTNRPGIDSSDEEIFRPPKTWDPLLWQRRKLHSSVSPKRTDRKDALAKQELELLLNRIPNSRKEALTIVLFLKKRLIRTVGEVNFYKERVTGLQNELIKQNSKEEELIKLRSAFNEQSLEMQHLEANKEERQMLRKTVRQQESIIARLEQHLKNNSTKPVLENLIKTTPSQPSPEIAYSQNMNEIRLQQENEKLRMTISELSNEIRQQSKHQEEMFQKQNEQLLRYQEQLARQMEKQSQDSRRDVAEPNPAVGKSLFTEGDKYELYRMLDRAESRIKVLEAQLDMRNRAQWAPAPAQPSKEEEQMPQKKPVKAKNNPVQELNTGGQPWKYTNVVSDNVVSYLSVVSLGSLPAGE